MRFFQIILLMLAVFGALAVPAIASNEDDIRSVLNKQVDAWNKGDVDGFMQAYYQSAKTSYISGDTEVWGYDALRKRYVDRYGKTTDSMGKLSFTDLKILPTGETSALAVGHWHLERKDKPEAGGIYSLVFIKAGANGWKIVHDHTSASEAKH